MNGLGTDKRCLSGAFAKKRAGKMADSETNDVDVPASEVSPKSRKPPEESSSFVDKMTGTAGKITALLVAITAMLAAVPPITEGIKTIYCGIRICGISSTQLDQPDPDEISQLANVEKKKRLLVDQLASPAPLPSAPSPPNSPKLAATSAQLLPDNPAKSFDFQVECSNTNFFMVRPDGWDRVDQFKAVADPRVFTLITSSSRAFFSIRFSLSRAKDLANPIKSVKEWNSTFSVVFPDGNRKHCRAGDRQYRLDMTLDRPLPPGDYWVSALFDDDKTVSLKEFKVR
jgi:hypothetical protein